MDKYQRDMQFTRIYVGGKWCPPSRDDSIPVIDAARDEVMGRIPDCAAADVDRAVTAARNALEAWALPPPYARGRLLEKLSDAVLEREDELAIAIAREVGTPIKLSRRVQVRLPAAVARDSATVAYDFEWTERVGNATVVKQPIGVVACITPWNYPLHQIMAKIAPALAAGCTVVVKPSELAPSSAFILAEAVDQAGFPPGVFNLVSGSPADVSEPLVVHPGVDMISFTGSTATGRRVAELAARAPKKVSLELGGKSASIVLDDADLEAAVRHTVASCFLNSGQTCNALTRLLVPERSQQAAWDLAVDATQRFRVGDPLDETTQLGPLASARQQARVKRFIETGCKEGARLLTGGTGLPDGVERGFFVKPTVFGDVRPEMAIAQEEIFGPVLSILACADESDAVRIANGTPFGLSAAVWSASKERAKRVALRLKAGQVEINGGQFNRLAPFGGCGASGYGRELGRFGLEEFVGPKALLA